MKTLYVLRHAKSSWGEPSLADFDRPLNGRGMRAVPAVAGVMRERGIHPGLVVSSPALRARQTAELLAAELGLDAPVQFDARVYEAHTLDLLKVISDADEPAGELLLVGHNPGLEGLVERLTGERVGLPTAALARVELTVERWSEVAEGSGRLEWLVTPRGPGDD
jgi:phosphohistidine phosphatase